MNIGNDIFFEILKKISFFMFDKWIRNDYSFGYLYVYVCFLILCFKIILNLIYIRIG